VYNPVDHKQCYSLTVGWKMDGQLELRSMYNQRQPVLQWYDIGMSDFVEDTASVRSTVMRQV